MLHERITKKRMTTLTFKISGMGCSGCVNSVEQAILEVDHVESVNVDLDSGIAKVLFREEKPASDEIIDAVSDAGYEAEEIQKEKS